MKRIRFKIGNRHFFAGTSKQHQMLGVNSKLRDSTEHFLMWDFDETDYETVRRNLVQQWWSYGLPTIYIMQSSTQGFHAYCFKRYHFATAISIIGGTRGVDWTYFKLGVLRSYFTLRITDKRQGTLTLRGIIKSNHPSDVDPRKDVLSLSHYWTARG